MLTDYLGFYKLRKQEELEIELCSIWPNDFEQEERNFYIQAGGWSRYAKNQRRQDLEERLQR